MAWGGYRGRQTQEEGSGPPGAADDAAGLRGWLGGHTHPSGASPAESPRTLLPQRAAAPLLRSEAWAAGRLSAGRCCPLLGDARGPFLRELLGQDSQSWGVAGGHQSQAGFLGPE